MPAIHTSLTDTTQLLLGIAALLHRLDQVTTSADPLSPAAHIARHAVILRALALTAVPANALASTPVPSVDGPAQLLQAAVELALRLPIDPGDPGFSADLIVGLTDLHKQMLT